MACGAEAGSEFISPTSFVLSSPRHSHSSRRAMVRPRKLLSPGACLFVAGALLPGPVEGGAQVGPDASTVVLTNATLIDGTGSAPRTGMTIVVQGGVVADITVGGASLVPEDAQVVDLAGHFVLPGLVDAHVHLSNNPDPVAALGQLLQRGVTTVRDMGGDARTLAVLARDTQIGATEGPAIHYSALLYGPAFLQDPRSRFSQRGREPGTAPWSRVVTAGSDIRQIVAEARGTGAAGLKLYSAVPPRLLRRVVAEAREQDLKVWSHASIYPSRPSDAVSAGVHVLSHSAGLYPEAFELIPSSYTEAISVWFPEQDFGQAIAGAPAFESLFEDMARLGTILEPTVSPAAAPRGPGRAGQQAHLARAAARIDMEARNRWACDATQAAYSRGVKVAAGTDSNGSDDVRREIIQLVECGLTPLDAIRSGTLTGAEAIGIDETHGSLAPGKAADLVILGSDPTEDIASLYDLQRVMKAGRWIGG